MASVRANRQVARQISLDDEQEKSSLLSYSIKTFVVKPQSALFTLQVFG